MTKRAGIYGRNSKGKAKSISDQLKLGRGAIHEHGWAPAGEYSDGGPASHAAKARKGWTRLLADLSAGKLDVLVLWEASRGSREERDWFGMLALCRAHGVLIYIINDERLFDPRKDRDSRDLGMAGVDSAYEATRHGARVHRGVHEYAEDGGVHGRTPYGYERHYDEQTRKLVEQVESGDAPIVREIFERLAARTPISVLLRDLNARGVPSPSDKPWHRNTLRAVATNRTYIGEREYRHRDKYTGEETIHEVYPAKKWKALIDPGLFWDVQAILDDPERKPLRKGQPGRNTKPGAAKYLLSYIGTAPCGALFRNTTSLPGHTDRYVCSESHGCGSISRPDADALVERVLLGRLARPDARELFAQDDHAAREARAEIVKLRRQLEEARQSFEAVDGISAVALARKERTLGPLIEDAERRSKAAGRSVAADLVEADDVRAAWDALPIAARREVVKELLVVMLGKAPRRLTRHATQEERDWQAWIRLSGSRWVGDDRTWAELAA